MFFISLTTNAFTLYEITCLIDSDKNKSDNNLKNYHIASIQHIAVQSQHQRELKNNVSLFLKTSIFYCLKIQLQTKLIILRTRHL